MDQWITIYTFTLPSEAMVMRTRLESEGIPYTIRDENIAQVHNYLSNAVGGIKIQVRPEDYQNAKNVFQDAGYRVISEGKSSGRYQKLDNLSKKIPLVKKLSPEYRLLVVGALFAILVAGIVYALYRESKWELLTSHKWAMSHVTYKGEDYLPATTGIFIEFTTTEGESIERIEFDEFGEIRLPGFNTSVIHGRWYFNNDSIYISDLDTFGHIFEGAFHVQMQGHDMTMTAAHTTIYCYRYFLPF